MGQKMRLEQTEQTEIVQAFKEFMVSGGVPMKLQSKVKRYLEFQFKASREMGFKREWMFEWLSPWLRKELQVVLYKKHLEEHPFFRDMPVEIMNHTCHVASTHLCAPGDQVMQRGQVVKNAHFVIRGKLNISGPHDADWEQK